MSMEAEALMDVMDELEVHVDPGKSDRFSKSIMEALAQRGYIITLDPTPLDGSDTKGANLALQRLRELGYVVAFSGEAG